jgi:hypothetical protein
MHTRVSWEGNIWRIITGWGRADTPLCITSYCLGQCQGRVAPCKPFLPPAISNAVVRNNARSSFSIPFCIFVREMSQYDPGAGMLVCWGMAGA